MAAYHPILKYVIQTVTVGCQTKSKHNWIFFKIPINKTANTNRIYVNSITVSLTSITASTMQNTIRLGAHVIYE